MGQALYRKYRSKSLDEVIGQEHITKTLKNALKTGKISHAYLLTGPRGVGKTSVARILAYAANDLPYGGEKHHLDIIEIDAASNRRIDEIRDLRDKVHIAPTSGKYKIYIIDEVHMLTKEAFNALLKTLEEPPAHIIFILATTEAHKLPATIVSRTQRFAFKPIDKNLIEAHLKNIARTEKIKIDDEALSLIAEHGEGSFRDSISLLDQASASSEQVTKDDILQLLGVAPEDAIDGILEQVSGNSPKELLDSLASLSERGYSAASIAKQLSNRLRQQIIANATVLDTQKTTKLLKNLIDVPASPNPDRLLEILLLDILLAALPNEIPKTEPALEPTNPIKVQNPTQPARPSVPDVSPAKAKSFDLNLWPTILSDIKTRHNALYSVVRMGQPSYDGHTLTLTFKFAFHNKQINEPRNFRIIADVLKKHSAKPIEVVSVLNPQIIEKKVSKPQKPSNIETVSNIFGGGEVVES